LNIIEKDPFYETLKEYDRCVIDYCIINDDYSYAGALSHKYAVLFAILLFSTDNDDWKKDFDRYRIGESDSEPFCGSGIDIGTAKATMIDSDRLFYFPQHTSTGNGSQKYECEWKPNNEGEQIPYWYAFLEPPHGTGTSKSIRKDGVTLRKKYVGEDFDKVNRALFPLGTDELEVFEWTTDWAEYFDAGHEWWGTACWSIYDKKINRFVIIMASATD